MKYLFPILALAIAVALPTYAKQITKTTIKLPSMQCGMCKHTIEGKVKTVKGVESINVDVATKSASVTFDADVTSLASIEKTIAKAGYDANNTKADKAAQKKLDACCQPPLE